VSGAHPVLRDRGFAIIGNHDESAVGRKVRALLGWVARQPQTRPDPTRL